MYPIRVAFVLGRANRAGPAKELYRMLKYLDRSRFEPYIVCLADGAFKAVLCSVAPFYLDVAESRVVRTLLRLRKLGVRGTGKLAGYCDGWRRKLWWTDILKQLQPDVLFFTSTSFARELNWSRDSDIPIVVHNHGHLCGNFVDTTPAIQKALVEIPTHHVACAEASRQSLMMMGIPDDRITTIYTGIDLSEVEPTRTSDDVRAELGVSTDEYWVGSVASLNYRKGTDLFVRAAHILRQEYPEKRFRFVWIGRTGAEGGSSHSFLQSIEAFCRDNNLMHEVLLIGEREDPHNYVNCLDAFVLCSREECLPNVLLEAMALRKPCVAFAISGNPEALADGAGHLVRSITPAALADGIMHVLENPEYAAQLGERGYQRVQQVFDVSKNVRQFEELIVEVAARGRRKRS